jgi:excisionase family DNA binding protein
MPLTPIVPEITQPERLPTIPFSERFALSVNDAAAYVGLSTSVIRQEVSAGRLAAKRYGTKLLILRVNLESYILGLPENANEPA